MTYDRSDYIVCMYYVNSKKVAVNLFGLDNGKLIRFYDTEYYNYENIYYIK